MKGKKEILAKLLYYSKFIYIARAGMMNRLIVFNYHRIRHDEKNFSTPFDDDVFGPTVSQFRQQLQWLRRNTKIISERELIERLNSGRALTGRNVLITFDDGYIDNYTLAYPVLKELGIPAIYFISSNLINTRQLGWWDIIAYLIKNTKKPYLNYEEKQLSLKNGRLEAIRFFQHKMQLETHEKTKNLLTDLAKECELSIPDVGKQDSQLMNWDQIEKVSKNNITIGSHTHTHRVLSTIDPISQKEEINLSKAILEEKTGVKIRSIAFPVGNYQHITDESRYLAEQSGYELGFSFNTGINTWKTMNRFDVKRIPGSEDIIMLSATTFFPNVFTWGK